MRGAALGVGLAGIAAGVVLLVLTVDATNPSVTPAVAVLNALIVWSFVASGIVAWIGRPHNRIGLLMVGAGASWFLSALQGADVSVLFSVGLMAAVLPLGFLVHLVLAFPEGFLRSLPERVTVWIAYALASLLQVVGVLVVRPCAGASGERLPRLGELRRRPALPGGQRRRPRRRDSRRRHPHAPLAHGHGACSQSDGAGRVDGRACRGLRHRPLRCRCVTLGRARRPRLGSPRTPPSFSSRSRFSSVSSTAGSRAPRSRGSCSSSRARRRQAGCARRSRRALGDPSLQLAYWLPEEESYVDATGRPIELPEQGAGRAVMHVEREGRRIAALVHDPSLADQRELLDSVCAAAALALENERLQAQLRARVDDLRSSEARLRALIEASPLAIVEVDAAGLVTFWNQAAEDLYGWTAEEAIGEEISFIPVEREGESRRAQGASARRRADQRRRDLAPAGRTARSSRSWSPPHRCPTGRETSASWPCRPTSPSASAPRRRSATSATSSRP